MKHAKLYSDLLQALKREPLIALGSLRGWGVGLGLNFGLISTVTITFLVVAFSSRAKILGECSTIQSPSALLFLCGDYVAHTNFIPRTKISPQRVSELRRLWPSVTARAACELVS